MTDPAGTIGESATAVLDRHEETGPPDGAAEAASRARAARHQGGPRSRHRNAGGRRGGYKPTKAELEREVRELRKQQAAGLEEPDPDAPAEIPADELARQMAGPLAQSFKTASDMLARILRAPWWKLEADECMQLSQAWAPVLAPKLAEHAEKLPVLMAVGATIEVLMPRVEQQLDAQGARKAGVEIGPPAPKEGDDDARD